MRDDEKGIGCFMRSMCKGLFVALVAVLALGAVSSAAMGAEWSVGGSTAFGTEALSSAPARLISLSADGTEITCATMKLQGGEIVEGSTGSATAAVLGECREEAKSTKCKLSSPTITTGAVTIDAVSATEVEIAPKPPATELATYKIENVPGKECGLDNTYTITGDALVTVANASIEATEHLATFNKNSNIKVNTNPTTLEGASVFELASGKAWSIR
jgi:hypothetical protein